MMATSAETCTELTGLTTKEKISHGFGKKNEGNEHFKTGGLQKAIKCYHIALLYVKDIEKPSPLDQFANRLKNIPEGDLADIKKIRSTCYNNLSACFLKRKTYDKVIGYATKALDIEPTNTKALFRRGQAYINAKSIEKAEQDFNTIKTLDPHETCINPFLPQLEAAKKQQLSQEKLMYRKMMDGV